MSTNPQVNKQRIALGEKLAELNLELLQEKDATRAAQLVGQMILNLDRKMELLCDK